METQLRLTGLTNDIMFVKHLGTTKNTIEPEEYRAESVQIKMLQPFINHY